VKRDIQAERAEYHAAIERLRHGQPLDLTKPAPVAPAPSANGGFSASDPLFGRDAVLKRAQNVWRADPDYNPSIWRS
jgi:hypothetical protein